MSGEHAPYIIAAYAVAGLVLAGLTLQSLLLLRARERELADVERARDAEPPP